MQYDFHQVLDRSGHNAAKLDERQAKFGRSDVIPLWVADMDLPVAQPIVDALISRAKLPTYGYTSRPASYFQAVCDWQKRRNGWEVDPSLCSHAPGVVPALSAIVREFTNEGDGILFQTPVYSAFYDVAQAWNRTVIENPLVEQDGYYTINFADLEEKLPKAKLFLLCSPHNPVGRVWKRWELEKIASLCFQYNVLLVSDEIHSDLILFGNKHIPTASLSPEASQKVVTCLSATKTFNLAGLNASVTVFPTAEMKRRSDALWHNMDIERNNCFSLVAMEAAFRHGEDWLEQLKPYLEGNFRFVQDYLRENIPQIKSNLPEATYLVWLDCRDLHMDNQALNRFMVEKAGLGLNEGHTFAHSLSGYMRLNVACPRSVLEQAMVQLKKAVDDLH